VHSPCLICVWYQTHLYRNSCVRAPGAGEEEKGPKGESFSRVIRRVLRKRPALTPGIARCHEGFRGPRFVGRAAQVVARCCCLIPVLTRSKMRWRTKKIVAEHGRLLARHARQAAAIQHYHPRASLGSVSILRALLSFWLRFARKLSLGHCLALRLREELALRDLGK